MILLRPRILNLIAPNLFTLNSVSNKLSKLLKVAIQSNSSGITLAAAGTADVNVHVVDSLTLLATGFIKKAGILEWLVAGPAGVVWAHLVEGFVVVHHDNGHCVLWL
jgi:hypothetical protein